MMIGKAPGEPNDLLKTAQDGAGHTHVGDAPVRALFTAEDEIELIRLFNAILAGEEAVLIVRKDKKIRFMFSRCGLAGGLCMMQDVIRAKEG